MPEQPVIFRDLGRMEYERAWHYQESLLAQNVQSKSLARSLETANETRLVATNGDPSTPLPDTHNYFLFVEHPPVYTLGKSGHEENVLISESERIERGIQFFKINRGGDITYHGPGQIVGYPILDLEKFYTDIGRYLRNIEEVIIRTLGDYGICGQRSAGETGVWIDPDIPGRERKVCAIGVRCSRWITMHGFALNVNTDLEYFNYIIPCGIRDKKVTSMEKELGSPVTITDVKRKIQHHFSNVFGIRIVEEDDQKSFGI